MDLSAWQKKTVTLEWAGVRLSLHVAQDLFSSHDIDQGTKLLLRSLDVDGLPERPAVLDFGCGYGPLGLAMKARIPEARVALIDRDALAVAFTEWNARELDLFSNDECISHGGLDFGGILAPDGYDLILWNVPGKVGDAPLRGLTADLPHALRPNGTAALVVVNPLAAVMRDALASQVHLAVILEKRHTAHTVLHARRDSDDSRDWPRSSAFTRGVFDRPPLALDWRGMPYHLQPVYGLPEFDDHDLASELMLEGVAQLAERGIPLGHVLVQGVGQGHTAIIAASLLAPDRIDLVDRDLLSLEATRRNLTSNGVAPHMVRLHHSPALHPDQLGNPGADLILCRLDPQLSPPRLAAQHEQVCNAMAANGTLLIAGPSTSVSRFHGVGRRAGRLRERTRKRRGGSSAATWVSRS